MRELQRPTRVRGTSRAPWTRRITSSARAGDLEPVWQAVAPRLGIEDNLALSKCGAGCSVVLNFWDGCAAYAMGSNGARGWSVRRGPGTAERDALQFCRSYGGTNCTVRVHGCTGN